MIIILQDATEIKANVLEFGKDGIIIDGYDLIPYNYVLRIVADK